MLCCAYVFVRQEGHGRLLCQDVHRPGWNLVPDAARHGGTCHGKTQSQAGDGVELSQRTHNNQVLRFPFGQGPIAADEIGKCLIDHEHGRGVPRGNGAEQARVESHAGRIVRLTEQHDLRSAKLGFQGMPVEGELAALPEFQKPHFTAGRPESCRIVAVRGNGNQGTIQRQSPRQGKEDIGRSVADDDLLALRTIVARRGIRPTRRSPDRDSGPADRCSAPQRPEDNRAGQAD